MTVPEIVANPVDAVQRLYQQAGCLATDGDWGVAAHFEKAIAALGPSEVPRLNEQAAERLPHHGLVRFYGMVQDLLNPEYYVGAFQQPDGRWVTTKFCDPDIPAGAVEDGPGGQPIVWERRPVVCVPIPGLSSWALPAAAPQSADAAGAGDGAAEGAVSGAAGTAQAATPAARPKRERSSDADMQQPDASMASPSDSNANSRLQPQSEDSSELDTDPPGDQGRPGRLAGAATASTASPADGGDVAAARRRTRRREDPGASAAAAGAGAGTAAAGDESDSNATRGANGAVGEAGAGACETCGAGEGCAHRAAARAAAASAAAEAAAAAASAEQQQAQAAEEVPGSCMVYLYDNAPSLVLHEVVEVVGVLSHVPQLAALEYDNQDPLLEAELASLGLEGSAQPGSGGGNGGGMRGGGGQGGDRLAFEALRAAHPPTSKVMRLHAILVRRAPQLVPTPPITASAPAPTSTPTPTDATAPSSAPAPAPPAAAVPTAAPAAALRAPVGSLREAALGLLRWALGGDAVAAEYLLMALLARSSGRGDPATLGQLAINLCGCPTGTSASQQQQPAAATAAPPPPPTAGHSTPVLAADRLGGGPSAFGAALHAAISSLVPLSAALPLTVEACNGVSWAPARDPSRERTAPSPLQLAPGTVLLLDETRMAPGQLGERGVASMQALMTLARRQELLYNFESYMHPIPVDLPLVVLTQGRSLLRDSVPVRLPLNATRPFPSAADVLAAVGGAASPAVDASGDTSMESGSGAAAGATSAAAAAPQSYGDLSVVRTYLAAARAQEGYELGDGMPSVLEQYFVNARRAAAAGGNGGGSGAAPAGSAAANAAGMSAEDFHLKLTLARLLVLSHGEARLTPQRWQQLLELEHTREARLRLLA